MKEKVATDAGLASQHLYASFQIKESILPSGIGYRIWVTILWAMYW